MEEPVNPDYSRYHPRWHRERTPIFWWLRSFAYTKFISRELTSVFVAYAAALLLFQVWALGQGAGAYRSLTAWLSHPAAIAFHAFVLLALLFHTVTWLNLAPQALPSRIAGLRVPKRWILILHYGAWAAASAAVAWVLVGGA